MTDAQTVEELLSAAIRDAEPVSAEQASSQPRLLVERASPHRTVAALRDILAGTGGIYDRGVPVRMAYDQIRLGMVAQPMNADLVLLEAHRASRPYERKVRSGALEDVHVGLPKQFGAMYLAWKGEWRLPPLNGIASCPMLREDGTILSAEGYDAATGIWCERVPDLSGAVPAFPSDEQAAAALLVLRSTFRTFCFADAPTVEASGVQVVDVSQPPRRDESGFLVGLLTAVCRASLHLAPGVIVRAAQMSGAGAGKGLLARCISLIAYGREPQAVTSGGGREEIEKRVSAELIQGSPVLFLDNLNSTAFASATLASAITERPSAVRVLGKSEMATLNALALVIITGNGLTLSEDLARRFVVIELDARTENPEARWFPNNIRQEVVDRRKGLLAAALTIWRWGRLKRGLGAGKPLGSFEQWGRWARDPLLALGCADPAERVAETKQHDVRRQEIVEVLHAWWDRHGSNAVTANDLHEDVRRLLDPQDRGRQYLAAQVSRLDGTRMAGFVLTRQAARGKWSAAKYVLTRTDEPERSGPYDPYGTYAFANRRSNGDIPASLDSVSDPQNHRNHRGHRGDDAETSPHDGDADFEERAAVLEHDGGLTREDAEASARAELSRDASEASA